MATIYEKSYEHGKDRELVPGHHYKQQYKQPIHSIVVPAGETVRFYEKPDRSGKKWHTFYEGTYHNLSFYGIPESPGMVHVEKTELKWNDLVEVGYYQSYGGGEGSYYKFHKLPIGIHIGGDHFWNDKISHLQIPFGVCCEVYKDKDNDNSLIFDGIVENGRTHIGLPDYNYGWCVSKIKITADDWIRAGVALENVEIDSDEIEGAAFELANNSESEGTITKSITTNVEKTVGEELSLGMELSQSAGIEAGPETVKVSAETSITLSAGLNMSKETTTGREVTDEVSATVPAGEVVNGSILIKRGLMTADAVEQWKNKRTGYIVSTRKKISVKDGQETRAELH